VRLNGHASSRQNGHLGDGSVDVLQTGCFLRQLVRSEEVAEDVAILVEDVLDGSSAR
jgi:hypothetical protein